MHCLPFVFFAVVSTAFTFYRHIYKTAPVIDEPSNLGW